jgi:hypothetical protein
VPSDEAKMTRVSSRENPDLVEMGGAAVAMQFLL